MQGVTVRHSSQQFRSLLASIEILAAAAVSNALVLGSFVRDRGTKKQRFRFGSTGGHSSLDRGNNAPRRAITARNWGSDADLVGDLGMRLNPELTKDSSGAPRPAPIASPPGVKPDGAPHNVVDQNWALMNRKSVETDETDLKSPDPVRELQQLSPGEAPGTPRGMSFFDVGGLLKDDHSAHVHSRHHSIAASPSRSQCSPITPPTLHPFATSVAVPAVETRRGSQALLQDIGGLLSPSPQASTPRAMTPRPVPNSHNSDIIEALRSTPPSTSLQPSSPPRKLMGSPGLQDVGGLLS